VAPRPPTTSAAFDARGLEPDLGTIELLARAQLEARRADARLTLRDASPQLRALLDLCGLADALPDAREPRPA
jgi:hypothetical protein